MKFRLRGRLRQLLPALILPSLAVLLVAQEAPEELAPLGPPLAGTVVHAGGAAALRYVPEAAGPLFSVHDVVAVLGGELRTDAVGQSYLLQLDGVAAVFGDGSAAMTVGDEIVMLSQAARRGAPAGGGLYVPLDLLQQTYGSLQGFELAWDGATARLAALRRESRDLPVTVDLVHVQGITTVVLQFPEAPRYRLVESPGSLYVELSGDRLQPAEPAVYDDPLVRAVDISPAGVRLSLAPGVEVDNYTLRRPFRLVFEVFEAGAAAAPAPTPEPPRPSPGVHTIVIDPGHGGAETGAIGPSGTTEKELTLVLAQALKSALERRMPVRVVLTRNEDADLPHATRTALANQNKADLFLSIHLNSSHGADASGAETYFLATEASDRRAAAAAATENRAAAAEGAVAAAAPGADPLYDLQLMLWDLAQSRHLGESQRFAKLVQEELNGALGLRDRGVKQAPFKVLMGAAMPAVLVELGFLSNPQEEAKLADPAHRLQLVEALARAIERYRAVMSSDLEASAAPPAAAPSPPAAPAP